MPVPVPEPGLVISYSYLWRREHDAGLEEGRKDRPCLIILSVEQHDGTTVVTVAPVTHSAPVASTVALEIPPRVKLHLGMDYEKSWVVLSEVNQFVWPGYDLRTLPGMSDCFAYGFLPPSLFETIKAGILDLIVKRRAKITLRD